MTLSQKLYRRITRALFMARGRKPWTRGYNEYKVESIKAALADGAFNPGKIPTGYGYRIDERIIEYPWFFSRLPRGKGRLLDAGSVLNFDFILTQEALAEKKIFISTLAPEPGCFWRRGISYVYEDLRETCFKDGYFDWVASFSTVEHIGLDNTMLYTNDASKKESRPESYLDAIRELRRVLKPGGVLYLSFPFGKYKNHGWFQVFDGECVDKLVYAFSPSRVSEYHFRYEPDGWKASSREESKDATCFDIHAQKNYDPDFAAFSRGIVCLELVK